MVRVVSQVEAAAMVAEEAESQGIAFDLDDHTWCSGR